MAIATRNERLRCPFCGGVVGYIGPQLIPNGCTLVVTYSAMSNTTTVEVTAAVVNTDPAWDGDATPVADFFHDCQMVGTS